MPWKERSVAEERLRFVVQLLDGEAMTGPCREFGIARKTGYKILWPLQGAWPQALCDRSRRPVRYADQLPSQVESLTVSLTHVSWPDIEKIGCGGRDFDPRDTDYDDAS